MGKATTICHFCDNEQECELFEDETARIAVCEVCYLELIRPIVFGKENGGEKKKKST